MFFVSAPDLAPSFLSIHLFQDAGSLFRRHLSMHPFRPILQVKVQHQQFCFLCPVPAASGAHQTSVRRSDSPDYAPCGPTDTSACDPGGRRAPRLRF